MKACIAIILFVVGGISGCVYQSLGDTCVYAEGQPFYSFRPDELNLIVGSSQFSATQDPWLKLNADQEESALVVPLALTQIPSDTSYADLLGYCSNVEARNYELAVENAEWSEYWSSAKDRGSFSVALAIPGLEPPVRAKSFGFALIGREDGDIKASCGCFAK
jgi:hypothetical protein